MHRVFLLPDLGEGLSNAIIQRLVARIGSRVNDESDDPILEVETDKRAVGIPSPYSGILVQWHVSEGETVDVGSKVATFIISATRNEADDLDAITNIRTGIRNLYTLNVETICDTQIQRRQPFATMRDFLWRLKFAARMFRKFNFSRLSIELIENLETVLFSIWLLISELDRVLKQLPDAPPFDDAARSAEQLLPGYSADLWKLYNKAIEAHQPRIFVGSSRRTLKYARIVQSNLDEYDVTLWTEDSVFTLGESTLEALERALRRYDFGIFIFGADDVLTRQTKKAFVTRDNVLFEYGLFVGHLSRFRAFIIREKTSSILSDLAGITIGQFDPNSTASKAEIARACNKIRIGIIEVWPWARRKKENKEGQSPIY